MPRKNTPKAGQPVKESANTAVAVVEQTTQARSVTDIRADIEKLVTADASMDTHVHNLAVETLAHAQEHGDFTLFAQLVGDVKTAGGVTYGRGVRSRRLALIEWAIKFSPIRVNGDGVMGLLPPTSKVFVPFNVADADSNPFWSLKAEADRRATNKPFGIDQMLARIGGFTRAIDKACETGTIEGDEAALTAFAKELNAYAAKRARELNLKAAPKSEAA